MLVWYISNFRANAIPVGGTHDRWRLLQAGGGHLPAKIEMHTAF